MDSGLNHIHPALGVVSIIFVAMNCVQIMYGIDLPMPLDTSKLSLILLTGDYAILKKQKNRVRLYPTQAIRIILRIISFLKVSRALSPWCINEVKI